MNHTAQRESFEFFFFLVLISCSYSCFQEDMRGLE